MKEKLIDIVQTIDACTEARKGRGIVVIARLHCLYDGVPDNIWLLPDNHTVAQHCLGDLTRFGRFVPRNSPRAIELQKKDLGVPEEFDEKSTYKKKIKKRYHVIVENRSNFQDHTIAIAGDPMRYQYRNLKTFLSKLRENREDIAEIEGTIAELRQQIEELKVQDGTGHERGQITKSINELLKEYRILTAQQEDLKNITIYIRKQGEMRYSLIVDTVQTRVKTEHLFDGTTVIINGGPGTGKSTTMIHRLAYLRDTYAIQEDEEQEIFDYKLNREQRKQLLEAIKLHRDWMFFSPSKLLREYLAAAMTQEGLTNTSQKVWNWKDYCRWVMKDNYGLVGEDGSRAPFRVSKLQGTLFYQGYNIIGELTDFYLAELRAIKDELPPLRTDGVAYKWTAIAKGIGQKLEGCENFSLAKFVAVFFSLEAVYGKDCKELRSEKNGAIAAFAQEICDLLKEQPEALAQIRDLMGLSAEWEETETDETVEDGEDEDGESGAEEESPQDEMLRKEMQAWAKAYCYCKANGQGRLNDIQLQESEILRPLLGERFGDMVQKIGDLMRFDLYAQYTRGVKAIVLNRLPALYKKFRKSLMRSKCDGCNRELLRALLQRKQKRELHHQELALLLGFVNGIVKQIKAATLAPVKHPYVEAYEELSRPIIGIDEATDFSVCEIYAIQSLLTQEFSSLTLCGDIMQRLTSHGIKSWEELNGVVPNPLKENLKTSYRQSKKLLEVARQIYIDTLDEKPSYRAFMKSNKVPAPLVFINEQEHEKVQWIAQRIAEVYKAYGEQLPSIAIFVNDKGYIPHFMENLKGTEFFKKNHIEVLDGSQENPKRAVQHICVYPIDVVKGMEFDVVFFHNIDNSSADTEVLKRFIYVGVSRAAFFLGITLSEDIPEISKYFERNKDWFNI